MLDKNSIPNHIAIIMDGNGRWAKEKGLPRTAGHRQGVKRVKEIIKAAAELQVKVITLFAFSAENWNRPKSEISMLMRYLDMFLGKEIQEMHKNNVRFLTIGEDHPLPAGVLEKIRKAKLKTKDNTGLTVVLALNYGSRQEIVEAAKRFARDVQAAKIKIDDLRTQDFSGYLYTAGLADPDLLIRTSGEIRISNFLLWQLSYAEFYFLKKYWPDFTKEDLAQAIEEYARRERRFGGKDAVKAHN